MIKYPSLTNHTDTKTIQKMLDFNHDYTGLWAIYEKIHGANFQIILTPDDLKYASRKVTTPKSKSFFNYSKMIDRYREQIETLQKFVKKIKIKMNVYGEYFGRNVNNSIDYGPPYQLLIFSAVINGEILSQKELDILFEDLGLSEWRVPFLGMRNSFTEAVVFDVGRNTSLNPDKENNTAEGVVIQPYEKVLFKDKAETSLFVIKKKHPKFAEKNKGSKKTKSGDFNSYSEEVKNLRDELLTYINKQRFENVLSKEGMIESPAQIGRFMELLMQDAITDFRNDFGDTFDGLTKQEKKFITKVGSIASGIVREYMKGKL